jgi:hypothetical protein
MYDNGCRGIASMVMVVHNSGEIWGFLDEHHG